MWTERARLLDDLSPASWLAARLSGNWAAPPLDGPDFRVVPQGYPAYARILHPVEFHDGREPTTWARVAAALGGTISPQVRWHELIGSDDPYDQTSDRWPEGQPAWGNLLPRQLSALCELLAAHTTSPQESFFALWEGWGQVSGGRARVRLTVDGGDAGESAPMRPLLTETERGAPRLRLPHRAYFLLQGPLSAIDEVVHYDGPQVWWTQSPSLFWPADRAWCVATEIDSDSTLVGGSISTIDAVLAAPALEAVRF